MTEEKNVKLLESEKEEYLENHPEEKESYEDKIEQNIDVDETEFSLNEDEIGGWIIKLTELKVERNPIELWIDEETSLKVNFKENEEDLE